jgi:hypothetical protein
VHSHKRDEAEVRLLTSFSSPSFTTDAVLALLQLQRRSKDAPKRLERQAKKTSKGKNGGKSSKKSSSSKKASGKKSSSKPKSASSPLADVKIALGNVKRGLPAGVPGFVEVAVRPFSPL